MYDVAEAACSGRRPDRRRAAKLLIGQILIVLAVMTLGLWAATQWAAATLAYRPRPGRALVVIRRLPVS
jgi:type IV secretion system protein VirD4